ncbi:hypothetical protein AKO1_015440 [Acrasis kona]|uniref:Polymerase nucleotidyl transferase domain-containing protein n=2 Tax=Acrasis kona TaxID=1008807 RepID=A0AAW2YKT8_9EUKA
MSPTVWEVEEVVMTHKPSQHQDEQHAMKITTKDQILNIYLFGSRLYQCHKSHSDYDLIVVVNGDYFDGSKLIETETLNINIYHLEYFKFLLFNNIVWVVMLIHVPKEYIWKQTFQLKDFYVQNNIKLKNSALMDSAHHYAKSKKLWMADAEYYISKKNIVHAIRLLNITLQLLSTNKVTDFTVGNDIWRDIVNDKVHEASEWTIYEQQFKSTISTLMHEVSNFSLQNSTQPIQDVSKKKTLCKNSRAVYLPNSFCVINFVNENGVESLWHELSIRTLKSNNLFFLSNEIDTPCFTVTCPLPRQSNAMVLDGNRIVAVSHPPLYDCYEINVNNDVEAAVVDIKWDDNSIINLSYKIDGCNVILYKHQDEWRFFVPSILKCIEYQRYHTVHFHQFKRLIKNAASHDRITELNKAEDIVRQIWDELKYTYPDSSLCYCFELCLSDDKSFTDDFLNLSMFSKVSKHSTTMLLLQGVFSIHGDVVSSHDIWETASQMNWQAVPLIARYKKSDCDLPLSLILENMRELVRDVDPLQYEGVVLHEQHYNSKIKLTSPQFDPLHRMKRWLAYDDNSHKRDMMLVVKTNQHNNFLNLNPWTEFQIPHQYFENEIMLLKFVNVLQDAYNDIAATTNTSKEFADQCKNHPLYQSLFEMNKKGYNARKYLSCISYTRFLKISKSIKDCNHKDYKM